MSFNPKSLSTSNIIATAVLFFLLFFATSGYAQFYDLEVNVGDTTGPPGQQNSLISVYMNNFSDTVAGFELWLILNRPDRAVFITELDTVVDTIRWACRSGTVPHSCDSVVVSPYWICHQYSGGHCIDSSSEIGFWRCLQYGGNPPHCLDSTFDYGWDWIHIDTTPAFVGNIDTTGTLVSGWEYIQTRSYGSNGMDMKITAQANLMAPPYKKGIGFPQDGRTPLIKLRADIFNIPDTATERTVKIMIQHDNLDNFGFSDEEGNLIGFYSQSIVDTSWFVCQQWADPPQNTICMLYQEVSIPPAQPDSIDVDTILVARLDTSKVSVTDGSLTILTGICGDVNNNRLINIQDVTYLIKFLYQGGPPPPVPRLANCNGDSITNIKDVTYLILFLYKGGPAPICH